MKRILYFLIFLATATQGQVLDGTLRNRAIVIRDEIIAGRNTPYRVGSLFLNLAESKTNLIQGVTALGTNDYSVTISSAVTAYIDGLELTIKIGNANTAASTLNVNALGAKTIVDVASGDLEAGKYYKLVYNGTAFQLVGGLGGSDIADITGLQDSLTTKQDVLVSGTNIKTVNSTSLLGSGDVPVQSTLVSGTNIKTVNSTSLLGSGNVAVQSVLVSGTDIKTLESVSLLGSGNIDLAKGDVGLGNVDNTSDASKPVSTAQQTALNLKANLASPTFTGAPLAPTSSGGTNNTEIATTAFVKGSSPLYAGIACGDLNSALTLGTNKGYQRIVKGFTITSVRASVLTAQTAGSILTIDILESGVSILSTKITIDNNEKTSTTAATAAVISDSSLADDAEITVSVTQVGTSPTGLLIRIFGY